MCISIVERVYSCRFVSIYNCLALLADVCSFGSLIGRFFFFSVPIVTQATQRTTAFLSYAFFSVFQFCFVFFYLFFFLVKEGL